MVRRYALKTLFFGSLFAGGYFLNTKSYAKDRYLRPPGALDEEKFLATCIKCGQCVQVCPYHSLSLLDIASGNATGTPHIEASKRGCYLCDLFPCVLACPSGSLDHSVSQIKDIHMGVAFLKRPDKCLAGTVVENLDRVLSHSNKNERESEVLEKVAKNLGSTCRICIDLCPVPDAIVMSQNNGVSLPQVLDKCVGCGVCEELCPEEGVIVILPRKTYQEVHG